LNENVKIRNYSKFSIQYLSCSGDIGKIYIAFAKFMMQMPRTVDFHKYVKANEGARLLNDLEVRLRHPVFGSASIITAIDGKNNLPSAVHAESRYADFSLSAAYDPPSTPPLCMGIKATIAHYASSEVRTAMMRVLLDVFDYSG